MCPIQATDAEVISFFLPIPMTSLRPPFLSSHSNFHDDATSSSGSKDI